MDEERIPLKADIREWVRSANTGPSSHDLSGTRADTPWVLLAGIPATLGPYKGRPRDGRNGRGEHLGQTDPPQGGAVGHCLRSRSMGPAAGRRLYARHVRLAHAIQQAATVLLLVGLPIALTLAWYHGDRGEQRVSRIELAIVTLLFVLGGGIFWRYEHATVMPPAAAPGAASASAGTSADSRPSIAVLPFENRSDLQKDAYFVDGIHDDILTQLSKVSALKVISRTSVEQFRGTKLSTKAIADQLGVAKILEGGVQRGGDRVRINVQLIDANTDAHLWAETYDRELTAANIFAIQSEVAAAIADALKATLTPAERKHLSAIPTKNLEAWEAYQLGKQRMARRTTEALADAEKSFQQAIDRDPNFALAYVGLADTLLLHAGYGGVELEAATARAKMLVAKAQSLDPGLAEAVVSSAMLAGSLNDPSKAEAEFRRAIELNPNYATAHHWYSNLLQYLGRNDEALVQARLAAQLDPRSAIVRNALAEMLMGRGEFSDALTELATAIEIDPSQPNAYFDIGLAQCLCLRSH